MFNSGQLVSVYVNSFQQKLSLGHLGQISGYFISAQY